LIADASGAAVWRWEHTEPFGDAPPNDNPSGLGAFGNQLRFPGQYSDRETVLLYNYFRDYDSSLGRYLESDPIGLRGGLNTFSYSEGNPMTIYDPHGLAAFKAVKWVVRLGKRVGWVPGSTIGPKTALLWRKAGKDVCVQGRDAYDAAKKLETAAHGKDSLLHHGKDTHVKSGNQAHFQSRGAQGHTFYSVVSAFAATTYLGDGVIGNAIDFFNPLSLGKDLFDIYYELTDEPTCDCAMN
jgi:RHS repeat-associated protein